MSGTAVDPEGIDLEVIVRPPSPSSLPASSLSSEDSSQQNIGDSSSSIQNSTQLPSSSPLESSHQNLGNSGSSLQVSTQLLLPPQSHRPSPPPSLSPSSSSPRIPPSPRLSVTPLSSASSSSPPYSKGGFALPRSISNASLDEYSEDEYDDPESILVGEDETHLENIFIAQVREFNKWRNEFFTKKNGMKLLHKNKYVIIFSIVFASLLVALGMTAWHGVFEHEFKAWMTITIIFLTFLGLIRGVATPEILMMLNTFALLLFGIVDDKQALEGFANSSVFCIAVLCIVASGIQHTGSLDLVVKYILRAPPTIWQAQLRLMIPTGIISAFINNIPQVAMQIPMLEAWCRKLQIPTSKMMIPLSWSTILGGTLCILGTSANLLVVSLLEAKDKTIKLPLMEIGAVGTPLMFIGIAYIVIFSRWLLPDRSNGIVDLMKVPREYTVTAVVAGNSTVVGKTIEEAGLRHLPGLYLLEIKRSNGIILSAVASDVDIQAKDYLTFVGKMDSVKDLWKVQGLHPTNHLYSPLKPSNNRILTEAVISGRSELIGKTARQCGFRNKYGAGIISIHREGEHIRSKISRVQFQKGDCLLLESRDGFSTKEKTLSDFVILNELGSARKKHYHKGKMIFAIVVIMLLILLNALEVFSLLTCSLGAVFLLLLTRCITIRQAYSAVDVPLIVTIAGSFAMATAMEKTGVATEISKNLVSAFSGIGDIGPLASIYLCTMILTALLSNNAAVALMFPIAWNMHHLPLKPRLYILMYAASADFSTPFGYATNLMVYGPGGYKFLDYTKFGLPLQLLLLVCCVPLCYYIY